MTVPNWILSHPHSDGNSCPKASRANWGVTIPFGPRYRESNRGRWGRWGRWLLPARVKNGWKQWGRVDMWCHILCSTVYVFLICLVVFNAGPYGIFKYVVQMCKKSIHTPLAMSHMDVSENVPDIQLIVCFKLKYVQIWWRKKVMRASLDKKGPTFCILSWGTRVLGANVPQDWFIVYYVYVKII